MTDWSMTDAAAYNELSRRVIGAAIEVHRHLGPGLLESVYQRALEAELTLALDSLPLPVASSVNRYAVDPGEYTVHLLATTAVGCQDSTEVDVLVEDPLGIYLPNTFTPDNNGINDAFGLPTLEDPRIYELLVFDRWANPHHGAHYVFDMNKKALVAAHLITG